MGSKLIKVKQRSGDPDFLDGKLCLDFANTVGMHASKNPRERLNTYQDLVIWSLQTGIISEDDAQRLTSKAKKNPSGSDKVLKHAVNLREAIYRIFSSIAAGSLPLQKDLSLLNRNTSKAMSKSRLIQSQAGFSWDVTGNKDSLDWMLNPVVWSAANLLTSDKLDRVRECADDRGCGWLFLDRSRNRSRRWCDMKDCGNRAKAKRYYERKMKK